MVEMWVFKCERCGGELEFESSLAAPGKGSIYICKECKEKYWTWGGVLTPVDEVDPEDMELNISDVI